MTKPQSTHKQTRTIWTPDALATLQRLYPATRTVTIAAQVGHSLSSTYGKAYELGLQKSAEFMASDASGRMKRPLHGGKAHWFKPGHTSHNKGKKGICHPGSEKGHFGKGNRPLNYCEVGTLRINSDGYLDIKMADGRNQWFLLAHYNWWLATGHWSTSHECIWYKNGDKYDCAIGNLELITRVEHMRRTTIHRYPEEIVSVMQLRGALNRQINKHTKTTLTTQQGAAA